MNTLTLSLEKYRLSKALRPFSYSVALITCGLGIALAYHMNMPESGLRAVAIVVAGILLQAASNLANDLADLSLWKQHTSPCKPVAIKKIKRNGWVALSFTLIASVIGVWLVYLVGWPLLALGVIGVIGGYSYAGDPINYKRRGLGVPAVFLFTGVLMVTGAFYAFTGVWNNDVLLIAIPVSALSSALLIANELRDHEEDVRHKIPTLTVRIGFEKSAWLYRIILLSALPISVLLYVFNLLTAPLYLLIAVPFLIAPLKLSYHSKSGDIALKALPPLTGRFFMIFGLCFILAVL